MNKSNLCNSSSWGIQLPIQLQFCATLAVSISVARSKTFATHTHIRSHLHSAKICDAFSMTHHSPIRTRAYRVCHGIGGSPIDIRVFWMRGIACPVPIHISPGMIWPHCVRCAIQSNNVQIRKFIWRWLCCVCVCVAAYIFANCVCMAGARAFAVPSPYISINSCLPPHLFYIWWEHIGGRRPVPCHFIHVLVDWRALHPCENSRWSNNEFSSEYPIYRCCDDGFCMAIRSCSGAARPRIPVAHGAKWTQSNTGWCLGPCLHLRCVLTSNNDKTRTIAKYIAYTSHTAYLGVPRFLRVRSDKYPTQTTITETVEIE